MTSHSEDPQATGAELEGTQTNAVSATDTQERQTSSSANPPTRQKSTVSLTAAVTSASAETALDAATAKETYVWKAKLAQDAGRYEDMAGYMRLVVETGVPMTKDEDGLLAAAYKRVVDAKRTSRRVLDATERKTDLAPWQAAVARRYAARVDAELRVLCADVLSLVDGWLSSTRAAVSDPAAAVSYWKLRADYSRYAAEVADDPERRAVAVADSRAAYERADDLGRRALLAFDPVRLGLMLNYSVFLYQVCQQRKQGHDVAKRAFDDAVNEIDAIDAQMYDDATLILRLIRDNLTIWIQENGGASFSDVAAAANGGVTASSSADDEQFPRPPPLPVAEQNDGDVDDDASHSRWSLDEQPPARHDDT